MILAQIDRLYPSFTRSEQRVADIIKLQPNIVARSSINAIAASASVSEPTIIRFCRVLGCKGFQDFKQALSRDLGRLSDVQQTPFLLHSDSFDLTEIYLNHLFDRLFDFRALLNRNLIENIASDIAKAHQVVLAAETPGHSILTNYLALNLTAKGVAACSVEAIDEQFCWSPETPLIVFHAHSSIPQALHKIIDTAANAQAAVIGIGHEDLQMSGSSKLINLTIPTVAPWGKERGIEHILKIVAVDLIVSRVEALLQNNGPS